MCCTVVVGSASFWAGGSWSLSGESSFAGEWGRDGLGGMYGLHIGCGVTGRRSVRHAPLLVHLRGGKPPARGAQ